MDAQDILAILDQAHAALYSAAACEADNDLAERLFQVRDTIAGILAKAVQS